MRAPWLHMGISREMAIGKKVEAVWRNINTAILAWLYLSVFLQASYSGFKKPCIFLHFNPTADCLH